MRRRTGIATLLVFAACSRAPAGPAERSYTLEFLDDVVYAPPSTTLPEQIEVVVRDASTRVPAGSVDVTWRLTQGAGATVSPSSSSDVNGVAGTTFRSGAIGTYRIQATTPRLSGPAPALEVRVVAPPTIAAVEPAAIAAGAEVVIRGTGFSTTASHNIVLFDGVRGRVLQASETELRLQVPACLPSRSVAVTAALGFATSAPRQVTATTTGGAAVQLSPGESRTFDAPADLACLRLPAAAASALYLVAVQNVAAVHAPPVRFELRSLIPGPAAGSTARAAGTDFAAEWEAALRMREQQLLRDIGEGDVVFAPHARMLSVPAVGERRAFNVINRTNTFDRINATVRVVTQRAVIYVDDEAPAPGFSDADLRAFGDLFDRPIYPAVTGTFGPLSDIDGNQRVSIVFTPRINALTPKGSGSFAAGYFYGCDLLPRSRCSGSNEGEIFYSMVPHPGSETIDARTVAHVIATVPPVLAHELQHMIHFHRRGGSADALWLGEALAHTAEEVVADSIVPAGGSTSLAHSFRSPNYARAQRYLTAPASVSLLAADLPGSTELRGGGWLLLRYLRGHHGGNDLLFRLTGSTRSGVASIVAETGREWRDIVTDFGVALWADGAPELAGPLRPEQRFPGFSLRATLGAGGNYPLRPTGPVWGSFSFAGSLGSGSPAHYLLAPGAAGAAQLNVVLSGPRGAPFAAEDPVRLTVLRVR